MNQKKLFPVLLITLTFTSCMAHMASMRKVEEKQEPPGQRSEKKVQESAKGALDAERILVEMVDSITRGVLDHYGRGSSIKIAISRFQYPGEFSVDSCFIGDYIADVLSVKLSSKKGIQLVDRENMKKVLAEQKLSLSGLIDEGSASRAGKILGVDAVVTGKVYPVFKKLNLVIKVIDVETGEVVFAVSRSFKRANSIIQSCFKKDEKTKKLQRDQQVKEKGKDRFVTRRSGILRACPSRKCQILGLFGRGMVVVPRKRKNHWVMVLVPALRLTGWVNIKSIKRLKDFPEHDGGGHGLHR